MNTLITPAQALRRAFTPDEPLPPATIDEAAVAAAEHRYIVPGSSARPSTRSSSRGPMPNSATATWRHPSPCSSACSSSRGWISAPGSAARQPRRARRAPAADTPLRARQRALRTEARTLLRRASEYLSDHRDEFPEYDPARDILKRCSTDGCLVQIR